jgi:hypothetical protein
MCGAASDVRFVKSGHVLGKTNVRFIKSGHVLGKTNVRFGPEPDIDCYHLLDGNDTLLPQKRTLVGVVKTSAKGNKRTSLYPFLNACESCYHPDPSLGGDNEVARFYQSHCWLSSFLAYRRKRARPRLECPRSVRVRLEKRTSPSPITRHRDCSSGTLQGLAREPADLQRHSWQGEYDYSRGAGAAEEA